MERHFHTKEALFCNEQPVVLAVADTEADAPDAADVVAVVLRQGDAVVLNEGIWHDACRGIGTDDAWYYWVAVCDPSISDPWVEITGGPVRLEV